MATLRDIRRRISGVKSTQKITKAMKMVAAAKLRRAQEAMLSARPYSRKMKELLQQLSTTVDVSKYPLFEQRSVSKAAVIVVTADRGLCGAFNSNIIKTAVSHVKSEFPDLFTRGDVKLIVVGKKASDYFGKRDYSVAKSHVGIFSGLQFATARNIMSDAINGFLEKRYDRVDVVFNEFKSLGQQRVRIEQLLPIATQSDSQGNAPAKQPAPVDYIYEPSSDAIITSLVPKHLDFQMWRILLESNASEQGARMTAMENATTNATDLIRTLQLSYNKARQSSITKELLEIVAGAEALKKAG
ncbi:MAG: ATP synthase F1 subunit gamma [Bacteroidota bacterium]